MYRKNYKLLDGGSKHVNFFVFIMRTVKRSRWFAVTGAWPQSNLFNQRSIIIVLYLATNINKIIKLKCSGGRCYGMIVTSYGIKIKLARVFYLFLYL